LLAGVEISAKRQKTTNGHISCNRQTLTSTLASLGNLIEIPPWMKHSGELQSQKNRQGRQERQGTK